MIDGISLIVWHPLESSQMGHVTTDEKRPITRSWSWQKMKIAN